MKRFCNELVCCVGCQIILVITLCGKLKGFFMRKGFIYQGMSVRNKSFGSSVIHGKIFLVTNISENLWILKAAKRWNYKFCSHRILTDKRRPSNNLELSAIKNLQLSRSSHSQLSPCIIGSWLFQIMCRPSYAG